MVTIMTVKTISSEFSLCDILTPWIYCNDNVFNAFVSKIKNDKVFFAIDNDYKQMLTGKDTELFDLQYSKAVKHKNGELVLKQCKAKEDEKIMLITITSVFEKFSLKYEGLEILYRKKSSHGQKSYEHIIARLTNAQGYMLVFHKDKGKNKFIDLFNWDDVFVRLKVNEFKAWQASERINLKDEKLSRQIEIKQRKNRKLALEKYKLNLKK
jgi:hypothetical protein